MCVYINLFMHIHIFLCRSMLMKTKIIHKPEFKYNFSKCV